MHRYVRSGYTRPMEKPQPLCQRIDRDTVAQVVHDFYRKLLAEADLAGHFAHIDDWPAHERHIADFWWGLMGGKVDTPRPNAMEQGHRDLGFGQSELERWLELFQRTLQEHLPGDIAEQWNTMARQIGRLMAERRNGNG